MHCFSFYLLLKDLQRKENALRELGNELKHREDMQEKFNKLKTDNKKVKNQFSDENIYKAGVFLRA